jgi:hypothetical protein
MNPIEEVLTLKIVRPGRVPYSGVRNPAIALFLEWHGSPGEYNRLFCLYVPISPDYSTFTIIQKYICP